jgi:hypothetical protein
MIAYDDLVCRTEMRKRFVRSKKYVLNHTRDECLLIIFSSFQSLGFLQFRHCMRLFYSARKLKSLLLLEVVELSDIGYGLWKTCAGCCHGLVAGGYQNRWDVLEEFVVVLLDRNVWFVRS